MNPGPGWTRKAQLPAGNWDVPPLPMALPVLGTDSSISCNLMIWALVDLKGEQSGE